MFVRARDGRWLPIFYSPDEGGAGGGGGEGGDGGGEPPKTFTQEQVNDLLARQKGDVQRKFADYDQLKAQAAELATLKTASQSDVERLSGERDTLKGQNGTLSAQNMRLKVALEKGLVGDKAVLADRLSGDTEEAMKKDADELLKLFGGSGGGGTGFDGGARGGELKGGDMDALIRRAAGRA